MELDRLLHLLYGAVEITGRLRTFLVGLGLSGMYERDARVIVLILALHRLELLIEMSFSVEIYVVTGVESLPLA